MNRLLILSLLVVTSACRTKDDTGSPDDPCTWYADVDADGFGDGATTTSGGCDQAPSGYVDNAEDCDDDDASTYPGAEEICDGVDDDCDGEVDESASDAETFWADADGDGYGDPATTVEGCEPPEGSVDNGDDCDDGDGTVYPGAEEACNGVDDDCDGTIDEDGALESDSFYADADGDGYGDPDTSIQACAAPHGYVEQTYASDCDDGEASIHPAAEESCDGVDNDCDDEVDEGVTETFYGDGDGDGFGNAAAPREACDTEPGLVDDDTDCDDGDASVNPGASESCNGVDDDCDDEVDEDDAVDASSWYADADADGFGSATVTTRACAAPSGYGTDASDCDDFNDTVHPGADELCDAVDNDCDGTVDEDDATDASSWYADADGDGYGDCGAATVACTAPSGTVDNGEDCDDSDAAVSPAAEEICNGVDDDCDGDTDEASASDAASWYSDADGDGYGDASSSQRACDQPTGFVADATDCDDADAALNPDTVWYLDHDADGYGDAGYTVSSCLQPSNHVSDDTDCDDLDSGVFPGAAEICDGLDQDCDGDVDEGLPSGMQTWFADSDGDGYGDASVSTEACDLPSGYVDDDTDCDDTDAGVNPGAAEICDGIDQDCDGDTDEDSGMQSWYADADLDGYGDASASTEACSEPSGYVDDDSDCDDTDPDVNPDAEELCDGVDNDCDGSADPDEDTYGDGELCAAVSCEDILLERPGSTDGAYWLDPEADGDAFEAWCEMDLLGGGWLAVFNMMERDGNNTEAANMHASLIVNDDMSEAITPDSTSEAIHTSNIPLADYGEVLYGWAPSDSDDVTRYGTYTASGGLEGECYVDGYCGAGVAVATFSIEPTGSSITIYTGNSPTYPHVGLGWSSQIICWGYDNNASSYGHWANWYDTKACCTSGNTSDIETPGWRYVIYIR